MKANNWLKKGGIVLAIGASLMLLLEIFWIVHPPDEIKTRVAFRIITSLFGSSIAQNIIPSSIFNLEFSWIALWVSQISLPRTAIVISFLLWIAIKYIRHQNKNNFTSIPLLTFLGFIGLWFMTLQQLPYTSHLFPTLAQSIHLKYFLAFILADLSTLLIIVGIAMVIFNSKIAGMVSMLKIFFSFKGRSRRGLFWGVWLSVIAVSFIAWNIYERLSLTNKVSLISIIILLSTSLICLWIGLAVQIKRWHDRNKSGWMILINLIPIIGLIWVIIDLGFLKGTTDPNKYGAPQLENIKISLLLFLGFLCAHFLLGTLSLLNMNPLPHENYVFRLFQFINVIFLIWVIIEIGFLKGSKIQNEQGKTL